MKLLIADDELLIRKGLETLDWRAAGISSLQMAEDGLQAMEAISREHPDIILSDINMPGMDGTALAKYVSGYGGSCRVIFLTGYNDFTYAHSAIKYGVFDYILKPSAPDELLDCVGRAVASLEEQRQKESSLDSLRRELRSREILQEVSAHGSGAPPAQRDDLVHRIFQYIDKYYARNISLVTLAQELHFSSIYVCRVLKKRTGCTFLEILTAVRMQRAAHLLANTSMKVAEVAGQVGVSDQKYFSQVFKKTFQLSPMQYRKEYVGQQELDLNELLRSGRVKQP